MLLPILLALAGVAEVAGPAVTSVSAATLFAGGGGVDASVRVTFATTGVTAAHRLELSKNGVLLQSPAVSPYDETVTGYIENGPDARFTSSWAYRLDVVRVADNVVVATKTSATWRKLYGVQSAFKP